MSILQQAVATRFRRIVVAVVAILAIPALALAWYLGSPLFLDKTVEEEFPLTISAEIPSDMSRSDVETIMEGMAKIDSEMTRRDAQGYGIPRKDQHWLFPRRGPLPQRKRVGHHICTAGS